MRRIVRVAFGSGCTSTCKVVNGLPLDKDPQFISAMNICQKPLSFVYESHRTVRCKTYLTGGHSIQFLRFSLFDHFDIPRTHGLHLAAYLGLSNVVSLIIGQEMDLQVRDDEGNTALHCEIRAAMKGRS
jgi:hypothetical protein